MTLKWKEKAIEGKENTDIEKNSISAEISFSNGVGVPNQSVSKFTSLYLTNQ